MAAQLKSQEAGSDIDVTIGDFATSRVDDRFTLVYLVSEHGHQPDDPGRAGEVLPQRRSVSTHVFNATPTHVGVGEYDLVNQIEISRHW